MESDAPPLDGFQAEKRVVDATQSPGRDEDEGVAVPCHVVDGQQAACEGNHQAARTFEQDSVEAAREFFRRLFDACEVDGSVVDFLSQVRGAGIGVDFRHREPFAVFEQHPGAHDSAVEFDVF